MAITLISEPEDHQPAYNPIEWVFSSDNYAMCDFVYIADVFINGTFAIRLKSFPDSPMGQGRFRVERVLQDFLSQDFNPEITDFEPNQNSICDYQIKVRERYNPLADCTGNPSLSAVLYTSTKKYGWNGALQYEEDPNYVSGTFDLQGNDSRFLSSVPNGIKFDSDDFFTLKLIQGLSSGAGTSYEMYIETFDFTNTLINSYTLSNSFAGSVITEEMLLTIPVGPKNIEGFVTLSGVNYYTVTIRDSSSDPLSETKIFYLKNRCTKFKRYRFWWLNRLGGYDAFSFDLKSFRNVDITRDTITKSLNPNYIIGDRGEAVTSVDARNAYTVNSDWMTEDEAIWIEELFTSPEVYVYETKTKVYRIRINAAVCNCPGGLCEVTFSLADGVTLPIGTAFTFNVNDGSPIGMSNSGSGTVTGHGLLPGEHETDVACLINAGAIITGTLRYELKTITKIPIIISNTTFEEKLRVNAKNIQYTMEFRPSFKKNIQGS